MTKLILGSLFILNFIKSIFSQDIKELSLNIPSKGKVEQKDTFVYFKYTLDPNFKNGKDALQFIVEPNDQGKDFSDPDMYISSTDKYPTTTQFEWYADSFGIDIITIEPEEIKNSNTLYIGITCELGNCPFKLKVQYESNIDIQVNAQISMRLAKGQDTLFRLPFDKKEFDFEVKMFQISLWSPNFAEYEVLIEKDKAPGTSSLMKFQPSWIGSSSILIEGNDICDQCVYYVLVYPKSNNSMFILNSDVGGDYFEFRYGSIAFGIANSYDTVCHRKKIVDNDTKIIINTMLFSGQGTLFINPSENIFKLEDAKLKIELKNEKVLALDKVKDLGIANRGFLMICFQSFFYKSSYTINVFDIKNSYVQQLNNVLFSGLKTPAYLSGNTATKYAIVDTQKSTEVTFVYEIQQGTVDVYGMICKDDCNVDKNYIQYHKNELFLPQMIAPNSTDSTQPIPYVITIPAQNNNCELTSNSYTCIPILIYDCKSTEDCIIVVEAQYSHYTYQLSNGESYHSTITYGSNDMYYINIQEEVDKLTIILNSLVGDADLFLSKGEKPSTKNWMWTSQQEYFTPDVIYLEKGESSLTKSLKGEYYLYVYSEVFTSYTIMYYTTTNQNMNKNQTSTEDGHINTQHIGIDLVNGISSKGFLSPDELFRVFEIHKPENQDDIKFFLTSLKEDFDLYIYRDISFMTNATVFNNLNETKIQSNLLFKDATWKSNDGAEEVIISSKDKNYSTGTYYVIVARSYNYVDNKNATFYLTGVHSGFSVILQENVPHIETLNVSNQLNSQDFLIYLYKSTNSSTLNLNSYNGNIQLDVYGTENKNLTYKCTSFCKTLLSFDQFCPETLNKCIVKVVISQRKSDQSSKFSLSLRAGDSSKPEYLNLGVTKQDSIFQGDYHYYVYNIRNNVQDSYMYINFEDGAVDVYARLVTWNSTDTDFVKDYNEKNQLNVTYSWRGGKAIPLYDIDMKQCFLDPKNPSANNSLDCMIKITLKGSFSFNKERTIFYKVDYSGLPSIVPIDTPLYGEINDSGYDYFRFDIPDGVKHFTLSLNEASDSTTILLNKGLDIPVSTGDWIIGDWRPEILEIDVSSDIFKRKNEKIAGTYTGAIFGTKNTTYHVYISSKSKNVQEVDDYSVSKCKVKAGEKCYFVYFYSIYNLFDNFFFQNSVTKTIDDLIVISHLDSTYGEAAIYSSFVNKDIDEYDKYLPTPEKYEFSSLDQNSKNFLITRLDKTTDKRLQPIKKNFDQNAYLTPILLFTIDCLIECDLDFRVQEVKSNFYYIDPSRENIYYSLANSTTYLEYYVWSDQEPTNQEIKIHLLEGSASLKAYIYNNIDELYTSSDNINKTNSDLSQILKGETFLDSKLLSYSDDHWILTIPSQYNNKYCIIVIKTQEMDAGFSVKLKSLAKSQEISYTSKNIFSPGKVFASTYNFNLFFKYNRKYENVMININTEYKNSTISVFGSYFRIEKDSNIVNLKDKKSIEDYLTKQTFPSNSTNDFYIKPSRSGHTYSNVTRQDVDYDKYQVYVLLNVEFSLYDSEENRRLFDMETILFDLNLDKFETKNKEELNYAEVYESYRYSDMVTNDLSRIYHFEKYDEKNDYLVINIDRCDSTNLKFKILDQITFTNTTSSKIQYNLDIKDNRYLIKLLAPKNDYFLVVWNEVEIKKDNDLNVRQEKDSSNEIVDSFYMINYKYQIKKDYDKTPSIWNTNPIVSHKINGKQVTLEYDSVKVSNKLYSVKYHIYFTQEKDMFHYYKSICFLNYEKERYTFYGPNNDVSDYTFNLDSGVYYVGLTATYNEETFVYNPIEIDMRKATSLSWPILSIFLILVLGVGIMAILLAIAYVYYRKYTITKIQLDFEVQDVRNMATLPSLKTEEMKEVTNNRSKYGNLTDDSSNI